MFLMPGLFDYNRGSGYDSVIPGITTGVVKSNYDKDNPGMLQVEMFLGESGKNVTGWVPYMTGYAGKGFGIYHLPEVGSQVVIAFICGDRDHPVVLGQLWDKKNTITEGAVTEKNTVKSLKTKGGIEVVLSEEAKDKEKITVKTPGGSTISIDDENKKITMQDGKGENSVLINSEEGSISLTGKTKLLFKVGDNTSITVEKDSITLKSKDIKLNATGNIDLGGQNIKGAAKANLEMEGKSGATIKASGSLKINSSAMLEVKGSMVKIN